MFKAVEFYYNKTITYLINTYSMIHIKTMLDLFILNNFKQVIDYNEINEDTINHIAESLNVKNRISIKFNYIKSLFIKCKMPSRSTIRNVVIPTRIDDNHVEHWTLVAPQHARETAVFNAVINYQTAIINYTCRLLVSILQAVRNLDYVDFTAFSLEPRSDYCNLGLKNRTINFADNVIMPKYFKKDKYKIDAIEKGRIYRLINGDVNNICESKLTKEVNNYYLHLSIQVRTNVPNKKKYNICALDPGVRTFQTVYSPDGIVAKLGDGHNKLSVKISKQIDKYQASLAKAQTYRKSYKLNKRIHKTYAKLKNKTEELHKKTAKYLTDNFDHVLIPDTNISSMVRAYQRTINKTTVRGLLTLAHYRFRMRLLQLAKRTKTNVLEVNEAYTSKTCGQCGYIDAMLGGKKVFKCDCGYTCDRDIHGARNIYIRAINNIWVRTALKQHL